MAPRGKKDTGGAGYGMGGALPTDAPALPGPKAQTTQRRGVADGELDELRHSGLEAVGVLGDMREWPPRSGTPAARERR